MTVYRIALAKYADRLVSSGNPARWNGKDVHMIYTAESRALACLENIVHRNSRGLQELFRVMVIDIPGKVKIEIIPSPLLPVGWSSFDQVVLTRKLGNNWISQNKSAVLRVPSVIIPAEFNYLINPKHPDFKKIRMTRHEPFIFDGRLQR